MASSTQAFVTDWFSFSLSNSHAHVSSWERRQWSNTAGTVYADGSSRNYQPYPQNNRVIITLDKSDWGFNTSYGDRYVTANGSQTIGRANIPKNCHIYAVVRMERSTGWYVVGSFRLRN